MGSFSSVCAISKNYITQGDAVRVVFIASNDLYDKSYKPVFFPFKGKYNDYGYVDAEESFEYNFFTKSLLKYFGDVIKPSYREPTDDKVASFIDWTYADAIIGGATLPSIFSYDGKDTIFIQDDVRNSVPVYTILDSNDTSIKFVMILESVYQTLISIGMDTEWYGGDMPMSLINEPNFYEILLDVLKKGNTNKDGDFYNDRLKSLYKITDDMWTHENPLVNDFYMKLLSQFLFVNQYGHNIDCYKRMTDNLFFMELEASFGDDELSINILRSYMELYILSRGMNSVHTDWEGAKTQHAHGQYPSISDYAHHLLFHTNVIDGINETISEDDCYEDYHVEILENVLLKLKNATTDLETTINFMRENINE